MRVKSVILATALIGSGATSALAQFAAPGVPLFGGEPAIANGFIGAGPQNGAAAGSSCTSVPNGRQGPREQCSPTPTPSAPPHK